MKTILMALVLVSSVAAQARVIVKVNFEEERLLSVENVGIGPSGYIFLVAGPSYKFVISQKAVQSTGLSTKELVDYIRTFDKDSKNHLTLNLRGNAVEFDQVGVSFPK